MMRRQRRRGAGQSWCPTELSMCAEEPIGNELSEGRSNRREKVANALRVPRRASEQAPLAWHCQGALEAEVDVHGAP